MEKPRDIMKQGAYYTVREKKIIMNVYKYFRNQHPNESVSHAVILTTQATGCSERSVYQFRKEEASIEGLKEPSRIRKKRKDRRSYDNMKKTILEIICTLRGNKIMPTFNTIVEIANQDMRLPNFKNTTFRKVLSRLGFGYERDGKKWVVIDKDQNYDENKPIWKTDEKNTITEINNQDSTAKSDHIQGYTFVKQENICEDQYNTIEYNDHKDYNVIEYNYKKKCKEEDTRSGQYMMNLDREECTVTNGQEYICNSEKQWNDKTEQNYVDYANYVYLKVENEEEHISEETGLNYQ